MHSLIRYPFMGDGIVYFGWLARAYLQDLNGFWQIYKDQQAPIYFFIHWLFSKAFGFSYQSALWVQFALTLILVFWIAKLLATSGKSIYLFLLTFGVLSISGFYQYVIGGFFDFRLDLWGSLVLSVALLFLRSKPVYGVLAIAIAISERFHNLSVIALVAFFLVVTSNLKSEAMSGRKISLLPILNVLGAVVSLMIFRFEYLANMWKGYRSHLNIQTSEQLRGFMFSNVGSDGYWTFYLNSFLRSYFLQNIWLASTFLFLILVLCYFRKKIHLAYGKSLPLIYGAIASLLLLHVNSARNNEGVLRYFLVPVLIAFSYLIFECSKILERKYKILLYFPIVVFVVGVGVGSWNLLAVEKSIDYKGLQSKNIESQMTEIHGKISSYLKTRNKSQAKISATFHSDYGISDLYPWAIYRASQDLFQSDIEFKELFGSDIYYEDGDHILNTLAQSDIIVFGDTSCRQNNVPLNIQLNKISDEVRNLAHSRCKDKIAALDIDCKIEILGCGDGTK